MKFKVSLLAGVIAAGLAVPASAGATTLIGSGSVAAQPVFLALFGAYHRLHPNISFTYTANGGNAGVKDVQAGRSQFAGQARSPLPSDAGTTYVKAYLDGLCILVNPANQLHTLTLQQLAQIYTGHVNNWSSFPGSKLTTTIDPYGRDANGGTYTFFSSAVLGGKAPAQNVNALSSDGLIANAVKQDKNAVGYDGLAYAGLLRPIKLNGIACSAYNVLHQTYPLTRFIFFVLPNSNPSPDVQQFVDWARTSVAARNVINRAGGVAVFNKHAKKKRRHR